MRKPISKFALAASVSLALAFTFSCSSGGDDNNGSGGGVQFNEDPQIYNKDGSLFKGSGVVKWNSSTERNGDKDTTINIMSVTNGIVKVELPPYPEKYPYNDGWLGGCNVSPEGTILSYDDDFPLYDSNGEYLGKLWLGYSDSGKEWEYLVFLLYSPKNAKVTCDKYTKGNIDVKSGWNKVYATAESCDAEYIVCEGGIVSSNNFFTKPAKWTIITD